jgi:DNA-binding response OmpR family regulator
MRETRELDSKDVTTLTVGDITLQIEGHRLIGPRGEVRLTASHFRVMQRLMQRPGVIVSVSDLIGELYPDPDMEGEDPEGCLRQVLLSLRRAIALVNAKGVVRITAEPGVGYLIEGRRS